MAFSWILAGIFLFIASIEINAQGPPPKIDGSYRATGEMVKILDDGSAINVQIAFDESYDAETENAAFRIWIMGKRVTYKEDFKTKQTFMYILANGKTECKEMTVNEWIQTKSPPSLLSYEDTNGTVRFSLKQLFALDDKYLTERDISEEFRGLPTRKWKYEIIGTENDKGIRIIVTVESHWSDGSWDTTSNKEQVPIGFKVTKKEYNKGAPGREYHTQYINVFGFVPDIIDPKMFEAEQGIICPNKKETLKFPDVSKFQAIAFHSEVIFPDYQQINYVDTWFDPKNKLLRQDMERIKDEAPRNPKKSRKYQSEMVLGKLGVVYRLVYDDGIVSCSVINVQDFEMDIQNLINFKLSLSDWSMEKLFGLNQTKYIYIGMTSKRDMPCHLFQGVRNDWPEPSAQVESLWEWCFSLNVTTKNDAVLFRNSEYGLVQAQIKVLKSASPGDLPVNYRIFHHFYDVNLMDPDLMDATSFEIDRCFEEENKRRLQFVIDWAVNEDNIYLIQNATSDLTFLQKWKSALYQYSGIKSDSLRITQVKATIADKQLYLKFTILGIHQGLPKEIKDQQIGPFEAEKRLKTSINNKRLVVYYWPPKRQFIKLVGVPHSMNFQLNSSFEPHILSTTTSKPSTSTTRIHFTLKPDNDSSSASPASETASVTGSQSVPVTATSPITNTPPIKEGSTTPPTTPPGDIKTLHKAGTVAGVSIAMVIIGITIGASGVFIKTNGLPPFMKCTST